MGSEPLHLLDVTDFTPEQIERVTAWNDVCMRKARIEELGRLATAYAEHRIENHWDLIYYMAERMAELAIEQATGES